MHQTTPHHQPHITTATTTTTRILLSSPVSELKTFLANLYISKHKPVRVYGIPNGLDRAAKVLKVCVVFPDSSRAGEVV